MWQHTTAGLLIIGAISVSAAATDATRPFPEAGEWPAPAPPLWQVTLPNCGKIGPPAIAAIDADGRAEILLADGDGKVQCLGGPAGLILAPRD